MTLVQPDESRSMAALGYIRDARPGWFELPLRSNPGSVSARVEQGGDGRQVGDVSWGHNGGSSMARVIRGDHGREVGTS